MTRGQLLKMSNSAIDKGVRIAGTKFDRRIKVTDNMKKKMRNLREKGVSYAKIAEELSVDPSTVRYHLDDMYRVSHNANRALYARSTPRIDMAARVQYKKELLKSRKKLTIV